MAEQNEDMYTIGYLSAIEQLRQELANGYDIADSLDRLEATARRSAERRGLELASPEAGADDFRTDEERDTDDRLDWLEWLHGTPDEPACPECGAPMTNRDQRTGEYWCYWCSARESAEFDESPIAGDRDTGGPADDFYDRGDDIREH